MSKCLNCGKELIHTEGRRPKKYCNSSCKIAFWNKTHKGQPKYVKIATYDKLKQEFQLLKSKIVYATATPSSYDSPPINNMVIDELNQFSDPLNPELERKKGESSIEYRLRMIELSEEKNRK